MHRLQYRFKDPIHYKLIKRVLQRILHKGNYSFPRKNLSFFPWYFKRPLNLSYSPFFLQILSSIQQNRGIWILRTLSQKLQHTNARKNGNRKKLSPLSYLPTMKRDVENIHICGINKKSSLKRECIIEYNANNIPTRMFIVKILL